MERRLSAILAADVVGYSRLMEADEEGTLTALKAHRAEIIDPIIAAHHGRMVKLMGDGALVEFPSVVDAVACAVAVQRAIAERNAEEPEDRRIVFRVGVNLGDVIVEGDDIYGEGVNVAARLQELAEPGGICVSGDVYRHVEGKLDVGFDDLGQQTVKNIARTIRIHRVRLDDSAVRLAAGWVPTAALPLPKKPSIAVLPFVNLSGDPEQEYFSDGITEDIITALSRLRWFLVIARNSTFVYKGKSVDIKQIRRELGVRYILEGSVRKSGNRLRIAAELVDAVSGVQHWGQHYDRELTDIFELQDDITQSVTAAIEPKLVAIEGMRAQTRSPEDLGAWELVSQAMSYYGRMTTQDSERAVAMLRQAVEKYPQYGPAHSLLAFTLLVSGHVGWIPESQDMHYAAELAHRAARLDDQDPWAYLALGYLAFTERQTDEAVRQYMRALDLNPNFATAYGYMGWALVFDGQSEEAIRHFQEALRMSPHDPLKAFFYSGTGVGHYYAERYDEAVDWVRKAIRERPGFAAAHRILCASLAQAGRAEETAQAMAKLREVQPNVSIAWIERYVPYTPRAMPHFLDGMRKAGLE
ncbi:MAG: adenylate/guanylate cyclase domain-containing protein [Alphaproteobacteria bacterium]|nr:adenylate/guanylate cyclase domain-containing protein [Alphaproteobacteria bacterium]